MPIAGALPGLPGSAADPGEGPAEDAALDGLLDDGGLRGTGPAAALDAHRHLLRGDHRELVGALVVPAGSAAELPPLLTAGDLGMRILLAADGPEALDALLAARSVLMDEDRAEVIGLRLPLPALPGDPAAAAQALLASVHSTVPAWITVPAGTPASALDVLSRDGAENVAVDVAGADPVALAGLLRDLVDRDLTFRATGAPGILRADGTPGVLNLLCAVRAALNGAETAELAEVLLATGSAGLTSAVRRMSAADAAVTRAFLAAVEIGDATAAAAELDRLGLMP
jgi:hypothetical protein